MWRSRAVQRMLVEDVAGLRPFGGRWRAGDEPAADERRGVESEALAQARRQALIVVGLAWAALTVLVAIRQAAGPVLHFAGEEAILSCGLLVVAVFSGFRLGQWEKYRAVSRLHEELSERSPGD